jgi:hypothetical protein
MAILSKPFEVTWTRPCGMTIAQRCPTLDQARTIAAVKATTLPVGSVIRICEHRRDPDGTAVSVQRFEQCIGRQKGMPKNRRVTRAGA